jgi:hypothetical protein
VSLPADSASVADFILPRTYHAILEFLFFSQSRWPSPPHLLRMTSFVPPAYDDPPTPPSPIVIPPPIVDSPPAPQNVVLVSKARPVRRKVLSEKPVNQQVALLSRSTSSPSKKPKDEQSPFTALPPRLSAKLRGARGKLSSESPKRVDTGFLGDNATKRRQGQFNAAMRRLEGIGAPAEQRSDSETDDTGVLEAQGEATDELTFTKSVLAFPGCSLSADLVRSAGRRACRSTGRACAASRASRRCDDLPKLRSSLSLASSFVVLAPLARLSVPSALTPSPSPSPEGPL